jgi:hypothetical protein
VLTVYSKDIPPSAVASGKIGVRVNIVPGASTDQSAYRSEVAGLFGIATMVREICALHDITAGTVYLGCDGLSALLNCTDIDYVVKPSSSFRLDYRHQGYAATVPS